MGNFSIPSPLNLGRQRQPISLFVALGLIGVASVRAAAPATSADFDKSVAPFLAQHCNRCHDAKTQKGDFRLDTLSRKIGVENTPQWIEIMERINSGEMPPKKEKEQPSAAEQIGRAHV